MPPSPDVPTRHPGRVPVWVLVSAAWLGPAILAVFQAFGEAGLGNRGPVTWRVAVWEGGDWLLYALLTPMVFWLARRYPLTGGRLGLRIPLHFAAAVALCALWAGGGLGLSWALFRSTPFGGGPIGWFLTSLPFGVAVYFAVLGVEHAAFYYVQARNRETQAARLSAQLAEVRLGALRMQMQPHFLLNSLNALTVVVRDRDTSTAVRMLENLGDMLRRIVRSDRPAEVSLGEELDFVRQLLEIEQVRFPDRLRPVFDVDPAVLRAAVPDFILQPLVENALRHGLAVRSEATQLRIAAAREGDVLVLSVTDDGPGPEPATAGRREGIGLANTRERLATLYGTRASLTLAGSATGGTMAVVRIPYRELDAPEEPPHG